MRAMGVTRALEEAIKIWIALGGVILAMVWTWIPKKKLREGLLLALVIIAFANYARYDLSRFTGIDTYDVIPYYLSTRYFEEVGYFDLWPALLYADQTNGPFDRRLNRVRIQDAEHGYRRMSISRGMRHGREVRQNFSDERWAQFEDDFLQLQRETRFPRANWRMLMDDRGFNGTPAWILMATPLARLIPARSVKWLCMVDLLLLGFGLFMVRRAFGKNVMLWALFFLFVTYSWRWTIPGKVVLRHDWISALMVGLSLVKMNRPYLAGIATGYATMMRFFPAVFLYGPGTQVLSGLLKRRKIEIAPYKKPLGLALVFLITVGVLQGAAIIRVGVDRVEEHIEGIREHISPEELSSRRVGFAIGYGHKWQLRPRYIQDWRKEEIAEASTERFVIAIFVLLLLAWGLRRAPAWESYAMGFVPFFLLSSASYYYFSIRVLLIIMHAYGLLTIEGRGRWRHRVGLALLLGFEVFSNAAETLWPGHRVFLVGGLSQLLTFYIYLMTAWLLYENYQIDKEEKKGGKDESASPKKTKKAKKKAKDEKNGEDEADEKDSYEGDETNAGEAEEDAESEESPEKADSKKTKSAKKTGEPGNTASKPRKKSKGKSKKKK